MTGVEKTAFSEIPTYRCHDRDPSVRVALICAPFGLVYSYRKRGLHPESEAEGRTGTQSHSSLSSIIRT